MLARRQGKAWYLGATTSDEGRTESVSLRFLPPGKYHATVWQDGDAPNEVKRSEPTVTRADTLALQLASAGGAAVVLEPLTRPAP